MSRPVAYYSLDQSSNIATFLPPSEIAAAQKSGATLIAEYMDGSKKQVGERDPIFPPVPKSPYASAAYVHDCMEALYELIDASIGSALMLLPESKRNAIWSRFNALNALIKDDGMELNDEHAGV